jgi:hypothetical protein
VTVSRPGFRFLLLVVAGLFAVVACGPEYEFIPDAPPPAPPSDTCDNGVPEPELGETDLDCGGPECRGCDLGQHCLASTDCVQGDCLDGTCQEPGCENGAQDAGETDFNCGGPCPACVPGQHCIQDSDCESSFCNVDTCMAPACDDDRLNGDETDHDCGGPRCDGCAPGQHCLTATDCASGLCDEATELCLVRCVEGTGECDGNYAVECETNLLTTTAHCGACRARCDLDNATSFCAGGECQIQDCIAPYDRCNTDPADGCETNISNDAENCGGCGMACSDDHGEARCEDSECEIDCEDDYDDCNDNRADGCETWLSRDVLNCGGCEEACEAQEGWTPYCSDGECGESECDDGFGNCSGNPDGLCEDDLTSDIENCGRCGGICTVQNGTPGCEDRNCFIDDCANGFDNCNTDEPDGGYADGCEINTREDEENCGGCGIVCSAENGSASCVDGVCQIAGCEPGYDNCDRSETDGGYENGCETNTATDKENCGGCGEMGIDCDDAFESLNATGQCVASACEIDDCFDNFDDCDENPNNGCESDLRSDEGDCGECERECSTSGTTGTPGNECVAGACVPNCDASHLDCDLGGQNGCEIDKRTDEENCGACDNECASVGGSNSCVSGACVPGCDSTHLNCNGDPDDGCETLCSNAGTQNRACAGMACSVTCDGTHLTCDNNQANGCEVTRSVANCGACGQVCEDTNAQEVACTNGVCRPTCVAGWGACTNPELGCTTPLTADPYCGSCTGDCAGDAPNCVATGSALRCQSQITMSGQSQGTAGGATLNFSHTLAPGTNRLILLGIVAESGGNAQAGSEPTTVTFGGTSMSPGPIQAGSSTEYWSPDIFFYYLTEAGLAGKANNSTQTVAIDASPGNFDPTVMVAYVLQLQGVRQSTPISAQNGGIMLSTAAPPTIAQGVAISTAGSRIFSLVGALWANNPTVAVSPSGTTLTQLTQAPMVANQTELRASALYISGGSASTPVPNTYTTTWTYTNPNSRTHMAVVIHPLQQP